MKRMVKATSYNDLPNDWEDVRQIIEWKGHQNKYRFAGKVSKSRGAQIGQISKIAPYDDADYVWALIRGNGLVEFIQDGKILDRMQLSDYLDWEEDFESPEEFMDADIDSILEVLVEYNSEIKPRIIHN